MNSKEFIDFMLKLNSLLNEEEGASQERKSEIKARVDILINFSGYTEESLIELTKGLAIQELPPEAAKQILDYDVALEKLEKACDTESLEEYLKQREIEKKKVFG